MGVSGRGGAVQGSWSRDELREIYYKDNDGNLLPPLPEVFNGGSGVGAAEGK